MKKYFVIFFILSLFPLANYSQGWLNRAADDYRQRNQQRTTQRNNNRRTYQNNQRNNRQDGTYQQRRETQQQDYNAERVASSSNMSSLNINNPVQGNDKVVTLVTSGTGATKEEATKNALRNAIEQAFGTFVSANTQVLNDELIKDEITTVSTGNIKSYKELSVNQNNGMYDISVQAIVSIDQLTKFAQSKGMQAELAGASFTMNMKMRELNKKNEVTAIEHMIEKAKAIAKNGLFDYKLEIGEPQLTKNSNYAVKINVLFYENSNTKAFFNLIYSTLEALSLNKLELTEYQKAGLNYYVYSKQLTRGRGLYVLRNDYQGINYKSGSFLYPWIMPMYIEAALNYVIKDNLGNTWRCRHEKVEDTHVNYQKTQQIKEQNQLIWCYDERIDLGSRYINNVHYYILSPSDRIAGITGKYRNENSGKLNVPIKDYGNDRALPNLHFNPLIEDNPNDEGLGDRRNKRLYYQQEFFIIYSENELSKLNSITIEHKKE
jgi:hypothetical protein